MDSRNRPAVRVGIDTGGTFTDCVLHTEGAAPIVVKVPSTPADPAQAVADGLDKLCAAAGVNPRDIDFLGYGTTVATNAILETKWAKTAFVTSTGFRDTLAIGNQMRSQLYSLTYQRPKPLVPQQRCFEVPGRLDPWGTEHEPFDDDAARRVIEQILALDVESVAISLLFSYADAAHERRLRALFAEAAPDLYVAISSDVSPEPREFARATSTVINAVLAPVVGGYLKRLENRLAASEVGDKIQIMQSSGGVISMPEAQTGAHRLVFSGPAGGMSAAERLTQELDVAQALTFDMGGTSTDVGLIVGGRAGRRQSMDVADSYPLNVSTLDIHTVGAGGGSIAWRDEGGGLRVGPLSQGAVPGPACYGKGGQLATVTDANLFLGRLDSRAVLAGDLRLDRDASESVLAKLAHELELSIERTAAGILDVANASMVGALRVVSSRRGLDPRDFALIAFGGAGPLHANALARDLNISTIIMPPNPGVLSAQGMLTSNLRHDLSASIRADLAKAEPTGLETQFRELEAEGRRRIAGSGHPADQTTTARSVDLRYRGQDFDLNVPIASDTLSQDILFAAGEAFHREHETVYGHCAPGAPIELVSIRVVAIGEVDVAPIRPSISTAPASCADRPVYFHDSGWVDTPVLARHDLVVGESTAGPLIVEQLDSTLIVEPGQTITAHPSGNAIIELGEQK